VEAYVVFEDNGHWPGWWRHGSALLRPGFRHVWLLRWTGVRWVGVDVGFATAEIAEFEDDPYLPLSLVAAGARIVHVRRWRSARWHPRGLLSCVTFCKMALGIRAASLVQTPFSLYRFLLGEGQVEVVHEGENPLSYARRPCGSDRT
jgi:hypothetical protein